MQSVLKLLLHVVGLAIQLAKGYGRWAIPEQYQVIVAFALVDPLPSA